MLIGGEERLCSRAEVSIAEDELLSVRLRGIWLNLAHRRRPSAVYPPVSR